MKIQVIYYHMKLANISDFRFPRSEKLDIKNALKFTIFFSSFNLVLFIVL